MTEQLLEQLNGVDRGVAQLAELAAQTLQALAADPMEAEKIEQLNRAFLLKLAEVRDVTQSVIVRIEEHGLVVTQSPLHSQAHQRLSQIDAIVEKVRGQMG